MRKFCTLLLVGLLCLSFAAHAQQPFAESDGVILLEGQELAGALELNAASGAFAPKGSATAQHQLYTVDFTLVNYTLDTLDVEDSVKAVIGYRGEYAFPAALDATRDGIEALVTVKGRFSFTLPDIVSLAGEDELTITFTSGGSVRTEALALSESGAEEPLFSYDERHGAGGDVKILACEVLNDYEGETDDAYRWIRLDYAVFNWGKTEYGADDLKIVLSFMNRYGFEGELINEFDELEPLTQGKGSIAFRVPVMVTTRLEGNLAAVIVVGDESWTVALGKEAGTEAEAEDSADEAKAGTEDEAADDAAAAETEEPEATETETEEE